MSTSSNEIITEGFCDGLPPSHKTNKVSVNGWINSEFRRKMQKKLILSIKLFSIINIIKDTVQFWIFFAHSMQFWMDFRKLPLKMVFKQELSFYSLFALAPCLFGRSARRSCDICSIHCKLRKIFKTGQCL